MGTNAQIMDWMTYGYHDKTNNNIPDFAVFTGKSINCEGNPARDGATGRGIVLCIKEWASRKGINLEGRTYILQGFGNVGSHTAKILHSLGMILVGVGDHTCYIANKEGFNEFALSKYAKEYGSLKGYYLENEELTKQDFFSIECDIVIPAALGKISFVVFLLSSLYFLVLILIFHHFSR